MFQEQRVWLLYSLKLSGEATLGDLAELDNYLDQDPSLREHLKVLNNFWKQKVESNPSGKEEAFERHLQQLSTHLQEKGNNHSP